MHAASPNYGLVRPEDTDPMWDFEPQINDNWTKLADVPSPPSGTTLPQTGSYDIGDRFYKSDTQSIYILVVKDVSWGWHWRPVQDAISPWLTMPSSVLIAGGSWSLNPVAANPFAIAFDNRGKCHWRGVIGVTSGTFARNTSIAVFGPPPLGLRPRQRGTYMLGHATLAVNTTATSLQSYQGARILISEDPTANVTARGFGGTADFNQIHLAGISYSTGNALWYTP